MSAYIVDDDHLDYLVTAGIDLAIPHGYGPLRWFARDLTDDDKAAAYEAGRPWGAEAIRLAQELARTLTYETANRVGAVLWAENARSVNWRYDEDDLEPVYQWKRHFGPIDPVTVLYALDRYEYQACEHPEWKSSEAHHFCDALRGLAIRSLPGYGNTDWERP